METPLLLQAYLGVELSIHTDSPPCVFVLARALPGVELGWPYVDIFQSSEMSVQRIEDDVSDSKFEKASYLQSDACLLGKRIMLS